jgi:hypothetical protein
MKDWKYSKLSVWILFFTQLREIYPAGETEPEQKFKTHKQSNKNIETDQIERQNGYNYLTRPVGGGGRPIIRTIGGIGKQTGTI